MKGRPKAIDVDDKEVIKQIGLMGKLCATHEEMASVFDVSVRTIERYMADGEGAFCRAYKKNEGKTKVSLRRKLLNRVDESDTILIWATKTILKLKEPPKEDPKNEGSITFNIDGMSFTKKDD